MFHESTFHRIGLVAGTFQGRSYEYTKLVTKLSTILNLTIPT